MSVLGFIAVIVVCLTVFGVAALLRDMVGELIHARWPAIQPASDAASNPLSFQALDARINKLSAELSSHSIALGLREAK